MPTLSKPINIPGPWAYNGDKNTIPDTGADVGLASWAQGWGLVNQLPLTAGGIPPARADFNGALNALSAHVCYQQSGAYYDWSADLMYPFPARVLGSDGKVYDWVSASGAGTSAGAQDPTTDSDRTWWRPAVTGGDLPEFDGTTIKPINGKYGVPEFTAPTAGTPGKAGLVPGPEATPENELLLRFVGANANWNAFSKSVLNIDLTNPTSKELRLGGISTNTKDANTVYSGFCHSREWTNAPGTSGLLLAVPYTGNVDGHYGISQLFFTYNGISAYRTIKEGGISIGTTPAIDDWETWQSINAPRPQAAAGVGQVQAVENRANFVNLPDGGVWFYHLWGHLIYDRGTLINGQALGIAGGGTPIYVTPSNGQTPDIVSGWTWCIA